MGNIHHIYKGNTDVFLPRIVEFTNTVAGMREYDSIEMSVPSFEALVQATSNKGTDITLKVSIRERCCFSRIPDDP